MHSLLCIWRRNNVCRHGESEQLTHKHLGRWWLLLKIIGEYSSSLHVRSHQTRCVYEHAQLMIDWGNGNNIFQNTYQQSVSLLMVWIQKAVKQYFSSSCYVHDWLFPLFFSKKKRSHFRSYSTFLSRSSSILNIGLLLSPLPYLSLSVCLSLSLFPICVSLCLPSSCLSPISYNFLLTEKQIATKNTTLILLNLLKRKHNFRFIIYFFSLSHFILINSIRVMVTLHIIVSKRFATHFQCEKHTHGSLRKVACIARTAKIIYERV